MLQAHYQKGKILAKEGDFIQAGEELGLYTKSKADEEASELVSSPKSRDEVGDLMLIIQARAVGEAAKSLRLAKTSHKNKAYAHCVEHSTKALEVAPNSIEIRELRLACTEELGDIDAIYGDLR